MVPLVSLWMPILISAVAVFVVSSIIHMLLPYHRTDFKGFPDEDKAMDALRKTGISPGDYLLPRAGSPKELKNPAFVEKMKKGPVALITVMKSGAPAMGPQLLQWFVYSLVVSYCAGYVASRALQEGAHYLAVFRFVGCSAFLGYSLALAQNSIWYKRSWSATLKSMFDGLVYACFTAGVFGWLWPR